MESYGINWGTLFLVVFSVCFLGWALVVQIILIYKNREVVRVRGEKELVEATHSKTIIDLKNVISDMEHEHHTNSILVEDKYNKLLNQKKSSEVKLGKVSENLAPFLNDWPYDSNNFRFIGGPIDGVSFNNDDIVFIEIKTNKARLTEGQKDIKKMVKEGKIRFGTFRISEEGSVFSLD